jgi:steroid delta-isomerase-like uncharacterized protein
MSAEDNKRLARNLYEAWNNDDFDTVVNNATDDVEITAYAASPEPKRGKTALREQLQQWKSPFPDGKVEVIAQYAGEDSVTNECILSGTNTNPLSTPQGEIPATGKKVQAHFIEVWKIRDGKVSMLHDYGDNVEMMAQLGLMPEPQPAQA